MEFSVHKDIQFNSLTKFCGFE